MSGIGEVPSWIQLTKQNVLRSDEWLTFSKVLFDCVSKALHENGVRTFSSLSKEEQNVLLTNAVELLHSKQSYSDLFKVVSANLDKELSKATDQLKSNKQTIVNGRLDIISRECENAVSLLLEKWPENKNYLRQCHGALLSWNIRYTMWKLQLSDPQSKDEYKKAVSSGNKERLVSKFDSDIALTCKTLLSSQQTFSPLACLKDSCSLMRHLISYHQEKTKEMLIDTDFLLSIPFVYCTLMSNADRKTFSSDHLAVLTSQFELFRKRRPEYMIVPQVGRSCIKFCEEVQNILNIHVPSLVQKMEMLFNKHMETSDVNSKKYLADMFLPCLRTLLVGYVPLETVMYVWDHVIIGFHIDHYDPMPSFCFCFLMLTKDKLMDCSSWKQMDSTLKGNMKLLTVEKIRGALIEYKLNRMLESILENSSKDQRHFPINQTRVLQVLPPWLDWYSVKLQKVLKKEKLGGGKSLEGDLTLLEDEKLSATHDNFQDLQSERDNLIEEVHRMRNEIVQAKKELVEERKKKSELEEFADEEISRLQRRIDLLNNQKKYPDPFATAKVNLTEPEFSGDEASVQDVNEGAFAVSVKPQTSETPHKREVTTPAADVVDDVVEDGPTELAETDKPEENESLNVLKDIVARFIKATNTIAHGNNDDLLAVNDQTSSDMEKIKSAYDQAHLDVFRRPTTNDEIDKLPAKERKKVEVALQEAIKKRLFQLKLV